MPEHRASLVQTAVDDGAHRYFADRRGRVAAFVDAHFSLRGTLRLHRAALGWDVLRAPLNLLLAGPQILLHLAARLVGRRWPRAARLVGRPILLRTDVSRAVEWLVLTELLELPARRDRCVSHTNALTDAILATPAWRDCMQAAMAAHADDPAFHGRLAHAVAAYGTARGAASEITTGLLNLGAGGLMMHKLTPGAATLGPALATTLAQQAAIGSFPLGGWLGAVWYGWFPAAASTRLTATATIGLMLASTVFAAFAGIVSDPLQRWLGLHRRRLRRMVDTLERQFFDQGAAGFAVHDHYVARLLDVFDMAGVALRAVRS